MITTENLYELEWASKTAIEQLVRTPGAPVNWTIMPLSKIAFAGLTEHRSAKTLSKPYNSKRPYFTQDRLVDGDKLMYMMYLSGNFYETAKNTMLRLGDYDYYLTIRPVNGSNIKSSFAGQYFDHVYNATINCSGSYLRVKNRRFVYADYPNALTGLWLFDEGSGNWAHDVTSPKRCRVSGNYTRGFIGTALKMNGSSGDVNCGNDSSLHLSEVTLEAWVKPNEHKESLIVGKGNEYWLKLLSSGRIRGSVTTNNILSSAKVPKNEWTHVVFTSSPSAQNIYLNGTSDISGAGGSISPAQENLYIGGRPSGEVFNGSIDQVAVYDRALSPGEVNSLYNEENTPVRNCTLGFDPHGVVQEDRILNLVSSESTITLSKPLSEDELARGMEVLLDPTIRVGVVTWSSRRDLTQPPSAAKGHSLRLIK